MQDDTCSNNLEYMTTFVMLLIQKESETLNLYFLYRWIILAKIHIFYLKCQF
ncbi:hypothetical protein LguiA_028392 [Lonicera macranthoides]